MRPRRRKPGVLTLLLALALGMAYVAGGTVLAADGTALAAPVDEGLFLEIEANLMCTDGCGMALKNCENATAAKMRAEIRQKLSEGAAKEQIYAYMVSVYGEEVMAAPPPRNPLNIAAWVLPFLLILGGGAVVYLAVDRWVFDRKRRVETETAADDADLAAYDKLLDEEIKKYY